MIWINDKAVQIDINFLLFVVSIAAIIFVVGLVIGIETGRKLDHKLLKRIYFVPSVIKRERVL